MNCLLSLQVTWKMRQVKARSWKEHRWWCHYARLPTIICCTDDSSTTPGSNTWQNCLFKLVGIIFLLFICIVHWRQKLFCIVFTNNPCLMVLVQPSGWRCNLVDALDHTWTLSCSFCYHSFGIFPGSVHVLKVSSDHVHSVFPFFCDRLSWFFLVAF